jgi:hypothetical protein
MSTQTSHVRHCSAWCRELRLRLLLDYERALTMKDNQPILAHKLLDRSPNRVSANAVLVGKLMLAR